MKINNRIYSNVMLGMVSCLFATQVVAINIAPSYVDLNISGEIQLPLPCTISGEGGKTQISVDFGDAILTTRIDGVRYRKPIEYSVQCDPGVKNPLAIKVMGTPAGFGSGLLKTSVDGLGIRLSTGQKGDTVFALGAKIPLNVSSQPKLFATPVKDGVTTLPGKDFIASGTLHVVYN